jgi:cytochrome P450
MLLASDGFDDRQLSDEIVTLIVAGHETVATALTWTFHLLGQHPQVLLDLQAEVDSVLGDRRPGFADLPALTLTRQVVDEALRLYPPAWVISRRALAPGELLGREIPVGSYVFVSPYVLQRTATWWPNPDRFDPTRFAPEAQGVGSQRFAYIPFGAGPNLCIGRDLALLEAVLVVAAVVQRFELTPVADHQVRLDPLVTIRPKGGLPMRIRRR